MKYTKGPWVRFLGSTEVYRPDDKGRICRAQIKQSHHLEIPLDEAIANARLIAAAPELLDALKGLVLIVRQNDLSAEDFKFYLMAQRALRKAEGEGK